MAWEAMRLSRHRVVLRAALLAIGAAFMFWRAWETGRGARAGADGRLRAVLTAVEVLMGLLALAAASLAVRALRERPRHHTLHL
jgi:hypothetical protein